MIHHPSTRPLATGLPYFLPEHITEDLSLGRRAVLDQILTNTVESAVGITHRLTEVQPIGGSEIGRKRRILRNDPTRTDVIHSEKLQEKGYTEIYPI
jgi:hypothetical protein